MLPRCSLMASLGVLPLISMAPLSVSKNAGVGVGLKVGRRARRLGGGRVERKCASLSISVLVTKHVAGLELELLTGS